MGSGTITTSSDIDLFTVNESGTLKFSNDQSIVFTGTLSHTSTTYNKSVINNSGIVNCEGETTAKIIGDYRGIYNTGSAYLNTNYGESTKYVGGISIETTRGEAIYSAGGYLRIGGSNGKFDTPYIHSYNNYAIKMESNTAVYINCGIVESDAKEAIYGSGTLRIGSTGYTQHLISTTPYIITKSYSHQAINSTYLEHFDYNTGRLYSPAIDNTHRGYTGKAPTTSYSLIKGWDPDRNMNYIYLET